MKPIQIARRMAIFIVLFVCVTSNAETVDLTSATIAEINEAIDAGALDSQRLVELSLARVAAYDEAGPKINAVLQLNPNAMAEARALDEERRERGRRSALHGIPIVLKDNIDTADMPTTAGSFLLQDSVPPDDAFLTKQLRDAGAIILAKVNMSEFASGGAMNSLDGPTYNPHDPVRSPSGSSGGTSRPVTPSSIISGTAHASGPTHGSP